MFLISNNNHELFENINSIGLTHEIINKKDVLIKINHHRIDMTLLKMLVEYIYQHSGTCALTEGAGGYLQENLSASGFSDMIKYYGISIIDVDLEDYNEVLSYGEHHYIPKCFQYYPVRIAFPSASKRKDMLYSNNIKLFVGAVPRKMYQLDNQDAAQGVPRPKIHQNLHLSIANLFFAIQTYSPFQYYLNGGLSFHEKMGKFYFAKTFIGNDALELDCHIYQKYFSDCEYPDYLDILKSRL